MSSPPSTSIVLSVSVVLYHSSVEQLYETLVSLYLAAKFARAGGRLGEVSVVLIDNSLCAEYSSRVQASIETIEVDDFFSLRYRQSSSNGGFGAGHNTAVSSLDSDFHLILNPDVELAESALLAGLTALQDDPELALVSPRVLGTSGEQEFLCKSYPSVLVLLLRAFAPKFVQNLFRSRLDHYEMRQVCSGQEMADVLLASGCYMLTRSKAIRDVGGFDDKYFLYFEDFDFSIRLHKWGRLVYLPSMLITHHGGYAANKGGRHIRLFTRSCIHFFNQHGWKLI